MKVSIISPVYNCAPYIVECIQSLLAQTCQDFEVLLVDDHGTDDSISVARAFVEQQGMGEKFRFLQTPCNSGPGIARNIGIEAAKGEYVAFIDAVIDEAYTLRGLRRPSFSIVQRFGFKVDEMCRWSIKVPQRVAGWPNKIRRKFGK